MSNNNLSRTLRPRTWRTQVTHDHYEHDRIEDLGRIDYCPLCDAPTITAFEHWRIIPNKYPYDAVAEQHDQLVPKTHVTEEAISEDAWRELKVLKQNNLNTTYRMMMEALPGAKSIPGHYHIHLILPKEVG